MGFSENSFDGFTVSRETIERLDTYIALLQKWNPRINLVSKSTLADAAIRHFADSAQLWPHAPEFETWLDLGSGAGFPGLVIATIAAEHQPTAVIHLCESDTRKCMFLKTVARELGLSVNVHNCRIVDLPAFKADIISARALASLTALLQFATPHLSEKSLMLFPKGVRVDSELTEAAQHWHMSYDIIPSRTDKDAVILRIQDVSHV